MCIKQNTLRLISYCVSSWSGRSWWWWRRWSWPGKGANLDVDQVLLSKCWLRCKLAFEEILMTCLQPQSLAISCQMVIDAHGCAYNLTNTVEALSQPWSKSSPKGPAVPVRLRHYREHLYLSSMCFSALLWTENQRLNQSIIIIFVIAILIIIAIVTVIVIVIIVTLWPHLACFPSIASKVW